MAVLQEQTLADLPAIGPSQQQSVQVVADGLVHLYGRAFGGKGGGKYRISRKFLRELSCRRGLAPEFLRELTLELFERGYVIVDLETHFAILAQQAFRSYRRVTAAAVGAVVPQHVPSTDDQ